MIEENDLESPEGDESLGGRLTRFIIDQAPESRFVVLQDYSFAENDDYLIYRLMGGVFDFNVTLTPQLVSEIRRFAEENPGYARATLSLLDEYVSTRAQSLPKAAVPA